METPAITKDEFEKFVPVAKMPDNVIFDRCAKYFDDCFTTIKSFFLGDAVCDDYNNKPDIFKENVKRLMCVDSFFNRLNTNDITITNTGFGVVSNQNVAPASQFRIDSLKEEISNDWDNAIDFLITSLTKIKGWSETEQAQRNINNLCYKKSTFSLFGSISHVMSQHEYRVYQFRAMNQNHIIADIISDKYHQELLNDIRSDQLLDPNDIFIVNRCQAIICAICMNNGDIRLMKENIIRHLEENIDKYPTYAASEEYAARHVTPYENTSDDPTYIF